MTEKKPETHSETATAQANSSAAGTGYSDSPRNQPKAKREIGWSAGSQGKDQPRSTEGWGSSR